MERIWERQIFCSETEIYLIDSHRINDSGLLSEEYWRKMRSMEEDRDSIAFEMRISSSKILLSLL